MSDARLARIHIYPIKSLDGVSVDRAEIDAAGALRHDREYALFDENDHFVNGKREPRIHLIRATFSPDLTEVSLSAPGAPGLSASPGREHARLGEWFSQFFYKKISMRKGGSGGFPDDTDRPGPTLVSLASLEAVGVWMRAAAGQELGTDELSRRFRANLEIDECAAFYEDSFYGDSILCGEVRIQMLQPCARCAVPARDSRTGESIPAFTKIFTDRRRQGLPAGVDPGKFAHFYRISVNTKISPSETGKVLNVGDRVRPELDFDFRL